MSAEDCIKFMKTTEKLLGNFRENYEANSDSSWRTQFYDFAWAERIEKSQI